MRALRWRIWPFFWAADPVSLALAGLGQEIVQALDVVLSELKAQGRSAEGIPPGTSPHAVNIPGEQLTSAG